MYNVKFKKEFEATEHDLNLRITQHSSDSMIKAKILGEDGK